MQTFVRMSKLSDIVGRSDYISKYRAKVIAAIEEKIKPIFESKLPKTEEIPEKKEKIKEQEPPQITYGGRTR